MLVAMPVPCADAAANIVLDQIGDLAAFDSSLLPSPSPSQIFTDFPEFNCSVLEDFTVTGGDFRIERVSVLLKAQAGFVMFQEIEGYQVNFFTDVSLAATTLTGDASSIVVQADDARVTPVDDAGGEDGYGRVDLDIDVELPGPGSYWVGVSPIAANSVAGQFFVQATTHGDAGEPNARLANPDGGHGVGPLSIPGHHFAYAVQAVPEPGILSFWFLASGWWLTRRRRTPHASGISSKT